MTFEQKPNDIVKVWGSNDRQEDSRVEVTITNPITKTISVYHVKVDENGFLKVGAFKRSSPF